MLSRRQLLQTTGAALCAPLLPFLRAEAAIPQTRVTSRSGFGVALNDQVIRARSLSL